MSVAGLRRSLRAVATVGAVLVLASCDVVVNGLAVPAADLGHAPVPVPVGELDRLLLAPEAVNPLVGAQALRIDDTFTAMYRGNTAAGDCVSAGQVPHGPGYAGSGWTALRAQYLLQDRTGDRPANKTWQAVVSFPMPVDAQAFFTKQATSWPICDGRRVNLRYLDDPAADDDWWTLGKSTNANGMLSILQNQDGDPGWACQVALTVRNNVAVNVQVCTNGVKNQAVELATAIAKKIPVE
jgi:hypothetical protein